MANLWKGQIRFHTQCLYPVNWYEAKVYSFSIIIHLGYWIDYGVFLERNWVTQCAVLYIQMKESNSVLNLFFRRYFNALLTRLWHFLFNMIFFPLPLAYLNFRALVQLPKLKTLHHRVTHRFEPWEITPVK